MAGTEQTPSGRPLDLDIPLDKDVFLRVLLSELAGTLEEVVGADDASGFISLVGQQVGEWLLAEYGCALNQGRPSHEQVSRMLVGLKQRIHGDCYLISQDAEKIVLGNRSCLFGDKVTNRESLCMMTTNVLGTITAENLGYANVVVQESIARGDPGCQVVIYLTDAVPAQHHLGVEFFHS